MVLELIGKPEGDEKLNFTMTKFVAHIFPLMIVTPSVLAII